MSAKKCLCLSHLFSGVRPGLPRPRLVQHCLQSEQSLTPCRYYSQLKLFVLISLSPSLSLFVSRSFSFPLCFSPSLSPSLCKASRCQTGSVVAHKPILLPLIERSAQQQRSQFVMKSCAPQALDGRHHASTVQETNLLHCVTEHTALTGLAEIMSSRGQTRAKFQVSHLQRLRSRKTQSQGAVLVS